MIDDRYWFALVVIGFLLLVIFGQDATPYFTWSEALP